MNERTVQSTISRRQFFRITGLAGIGLAISVYLPGCNQATPEPPATATPAAPPAPSIPTAAALPPTATAGAPTSTPVPALTAAPAAASSGWQPNIYAVIDREGIVTVQAFRAELGQGTGTALAMALAEELDADWSSVRVEHVGADRAYGDQATGGSQSINRYYRVLREAGAAARQMLVSAAAATWSVDPAACRTEQGAVIHPDGKTRLSYGQLVEAAGRLDATKASGVKLKDPANFKIIGTPRMLYQAPAIARGAEVYGIDVRLPGMLHAVVARCPVFGGQVGSFDPAAASAVPGVRHVVQIDSGVAVVAENTWAALRGRDALAVTWNEGTQADWSSASIRATLLKVAPSLDTTDARTLKAAYDIPYLAHATMEPMNCVADVRNDRCEVWAASQAPQAIKQMAQTVTGLSDKAVTVHAPLAGGGFGRRHLTDYAREAVQLSKQLGVPVQVLWTRQDDLQHDSYHPLSYNYLSATLDQAGLPSSLPGNRSFPMQSGIPTFWWRSVEEFTNAYARECFLDEIAAAGKVDPLELRLKLVPERGKQVLQLAASKAGWGTPLPARQGRGIAYWATFGLTHVAQVAEVAVAADGVVRVPRVVCAIDCGQVVNPDTVAAQMEGGIIFALTAALKASITIDKGRVQQRGFGDYPLITMAEAPVVEVFIMPGAGRAPTGVGEMGVPPLAPAVANAVFAATGIRVRHLPIRPADLRSA